MSYQNRILTTPYFINSQQSYFWSFVASDVAIRLGEHCKHTHHFTNTDVKCYVKNRQFQAHVTCLKCHKVFIDTKPVIETMVGYFGF